MYFDTARQSTRVLQKTTTRVPIASQTLRVERSFIPSKDSILRLAKNSGDRPFSKHEYLGRRVIKEVSIIDDVIEDTHRPHRYHLRMRNEELELKVETFGVGKGSVYAIVRGNALKEELSRTGRLQSLDDMVPFNWMRTLREEWAVDGFRVAVDHTLFGSWLWGKAVFPQKPLCTGKVELGRNWAMSGPQRVEAQKMDRKLDRFIKQHQRTFPDSEGKIYRKSDAFKEWMHGHVEKMCRGSKTTDEWQRKGVHDD